MKLRSRMKKEKSKKQRGSWKKNVENLNESNEDSSSSEDEKENVEPPVEQESSNHCVFLFLVITLIVFLLVISWVYICCEDYTRYPDCSKVNPVCVEHQNQPHKILMHGLNQFREIFYDRYGHRIKALFNF
ncbi:uncharacterized protein LOC144749719 [Ciona intestinalis]